MQQRRVRLGDILDDYCPRERRVTNHVVVAMIDEDVRQTRCTTCDADHLYKHARVPKPRRKTAGALAVDVAETAVRPHHAQASRDPAPPAAEDPPAGPFEGESVQAEAEAKPDETADDEWPVHRPLIRATLPRPEGHTPERKAPDFTVRPAGGRFDDPRGGHRHRGHRPGQGHAHGQSTRFGGPRPGGHGEPDGNRHGNRPPGNVRGGKPSSHRRGPRHGSGSGSKRGR